MLERLLATLLPKPVARCCHTEHDQRQAGEAGQVERMGVIHLYLLDIKRIRFDVRQLLRDAPVRRTREKLLKLQLSTRRELAHVHTCRGARANSDYFRDCEAIS